MWLRVVVIVVAGGGARAASCCGECELIWRMANQSLVPYLLKPLCNRWMDPDLGSAVSAATCRWQLDLPRRTLRYESMVKMAALAVP